MYHSLSLIQDLQEMKNTREEEEEKPHYTTLNYKIKNENYPKPCISLTLEPKGVFIATRGQTLARSGARAAAVWPWKRIYGRVSAAIGWPGARRFEPHTVLSAPYQFLVPISGFAPLVLTNQLF